jgi:hypothetical protein
MAERKSARLDEYRRVRRAPDDYDAPAEQEDVGQEDVEEDAEYDGGALGAASADAQPDVLLDVPVVEVEEITLEVEDLRAQVSLRAEVLSLLTLHVGADVSLGRVSLGIKGVHAVAKLTVRLDKVAAVVDRVMMTIDNNPQILTDLTRGLGKALEDVGGGAGKALEEVGGGAGTALEEVGGGAGKALEEVGGGAGAAVESVGGGLKETVSELGQAAGRAVEDEDVAGDTGGIVEDDDVDPGREAGQTEQRPAERAARRQAARPGRPPAPSEDRPRRARRRE